MESEIKASARTSLIRSESRIGDRSTFKTGQLSIPLCRLKRLKDLFIFYNIQILLPCQRKFRAFVVACVSHLGHPCLNPHPGCLRTPGSPFSPRVRTENRTHPSIRPTSDCRFASPPPATSSDHRLSRFRPPVTPVSPAGPGVYAFRPSERKPAGCL